MLNRYNPKSPKKRPQPLSSKPSTPKKAKGTKKGARRAIILILSFVSIALFVFSLWFFAEYPMHSLASFDSDAKVSASSVFTESGKEIEQDTALTSDLSLSTSLTESGKAEPTSVVNNTDITSLSSTLQEANGSEATTTKSDDIEESQLQIDTEMDTNESNATDLTRVSERLEDNTLTYEYKGENADEASNNNRESSSHDADEEMSESRHVNDSEQGSKSESAELVLEVAGKKLEAPPRIDRKSITELDKPPIISSM